MTAQDRGRTLRTLQQRIRRRRSIQHPASNSEGSEERTYRQKDKVVAREIAGETLLVPIRGNLADMEKVFVLEGTGRFAWDLLDGKRSSTDIAALMAGEFDVSIEIAGGDIAELLAGLEEADLVERV